MGGDADMAIQQELATPRIKGRLRARPIDPIRTARGILWTPIVIAIGFVIASLVLWLVMRVQNLGPIYTDKATGETRLGALLMPGVPIVVVAVLSWLAIRGFRDRTKLSLALAILVAALFLAGAALIAVPYMNLAPGTKVDGNTIFLMDSVALFLVVLAVPLLWNLYRGRRWFTEAVPAHEIKTAEQIEAETGGAAVITAVSDAEHAEAMAARDASTPLVSVRDLKKHFPILGGFLRRRIGTIYAVDGVDFDVYPGEVFSVVGESGCGKTTLGRTLLQLTPPTSGRVVFDGYELEDVDPDDMRPLRRRMQIIFQDPFGSLNPRMPVSDIIGEGLLAQGVTSRAERDKRSEDALEIVGLRRDYTRRYPHEFSGGQRQRIGVARALALRPDFVVCDEPVSALDVSIQSQVLNLLLDLKKEFNLTYLFISHNLSVVEYFSDRIAVMYLGKVVELGTVESLYKNARHPYTVALLSAIPDPDPRKRRKRLVLKGDVPSPAAPPSGCRFHTRCWLREKLGNPEECVTMEPTLRVVDASGHRAACHFAEKVNDTVVHDAVASQSVVDTAVAAAD